MKGTANCFKKMAQFLKIMVDSDVSDAPVSKKIRLALNSLEGLWFTCNVDFVNKAVNLAFNV